MLSFWTKPEVFDLPWLVLTVIDSKSIQTAWNSVKDGLAYNNFPAKVCLPFHKYHFKIFLITRNKAENSSLLWLLLNVTVAVHEKHQLIKFIT